MQELGGHQWTPVTSSGHYESIRDNASQKLQVYLHTDDHYLQVLIIHFKLFAHYLLCGFPRDPSARRAQRACSPTRSSLPIRCTGSSPRLIIRRTVFEETPSFTATAITLRNRSARSGEGTALAKPSGAASIGSWRSTGGPARTKDALNSSLNTLNASCAACRAINRTRRVRSSSAGVLPGGAFAPVGSAIGHGGTLWTRHHLSAGRNPAPIVAPGCAKSTLPAAGVSARLLAPTRASTGVARRSRRAAQAS